MPPKKLSGKFEQLTFSLSPDLKRTVREKAKQDGINLSGLISGYLSEWVSSKVSDKEDPTSSQLCSITADQHVQQLKSEISGLKSEMAELKDIISASIRIDTNQLIPIEAPQIKETVKPIESPKTDITLDTYQSVSIRNDEPGPEPEETISQDEPGQEENPVIVLDASQATEPEPMNPEDTISMGDIVNRIVGREVSSYGTDKQEYNRTSKRVKEWMQKQGIKPIRVGKYTHYPVNAFNRYLSEKNIQ
jgi:hypothetical protein